MAYLIDIVLQREDKKILLTTPCDRAPFMLNARWIFPCFRTETYPVEKQVKDFVKSEFGADIEIYSSFITAKRPQYQHVIVYASTNITTDPPLHNHPCHYASPMEAWSMSPGGEQAEVFENCFGRHFRDLENGWPKDSAVP